MEHISEACPHQLAAAASSHRLSWPNAGYDVNPCAPCGSETSTIAVITARPLLFATTELDAPGVSTTVELAAIESVKAIRFSAQSPSAITVLSPTCVNFTVFA